MKLKLMKYILVFCMLIGACGCMPKNSNFNDAILDYLKDKYNEEEFHIEKLTNEFNGSQYIFRAVCTGKYPEKFVVYCYETPLDLPIIYFNELEYGVEDDYANIILQNQYSDYLNN